MTDLVAGRYPISEEEWVLDGQPYPPYRRTINRRDITVNNIALTQAQLWVFAVPVQAGDIFNFISFVATAGSALTHSWAALYSSATAAGTLLAQTPDVTSGFPSGANKLQLASQVVADVAQAGTPQGASGGPGQWATTAAGPLVLGVALYNSGTTGATIDGMSAGSLAGEVALTGQASLVSKVALAATATAPANLAGLAASTGGLPYIVLSRQ